MNVFRAPWLAVPMLFAFGCAAEPLPKTPAATAPVVSAPPSDEAQPTSDGATAAARCAEGKLAREERSRWVKTFAETNDARGVDCFVRVLEEYKDGAATEDIRWASRGVATQKPMTAAPALLGLFKRLRASTPQAASVYRDVHDAMTALLDPRWEPALTAMLDRPVDEKNMPALKDELFWQLTAAEALGRMGAARATEPLLKTLLTPSKADMGTTSVFALVRIGKEALPPTIALLKGENRELVAYAKGEDAKARPEAMAALVLGALGREEGLGPVLDALNGPDPVTRAMIARQLPKFPKDAKALAAFRVAYEKTSETASIPPGMNARESLLEASTTFFDASLVPWYLATTKKLRGDEADLAPLREAAFLAALKLMRPSDVKTVETLGKLRSVVEGKPAEVGKPFEREWKIAKDLVNECGERVDCYATATADPASQATATQFRSIKAAYTMGVIGTPEARDKLFQALPSITNTMTFYVAVQAIDRLSPKGDAALAAALRALKDNAAKAKDAAAMARFAPLEGVILHLEKR